MSSTAHPGYVEPSFCPVHPSSESTMADEDGCATPPSTHDASSASPAAITPKPRKKSLQIRKSSKTPETPESSPRSDTPQAGSKSPIDSVTPSFSRNLHKLITSNRRNKHEVVSLRSQVEKLQEENIVLDQERTALRTRVSSLELERIDMRSLTREAERARRRAEARLSSLSLRSASQTRRRGDARALAVLNADVDVCEDRLDGRSFETISCSGAPGPSALASPSKVHAKVSGFSLPARSAPSPYRAELTHASPLSEDTAELPALTPYASSPSSVNTPLPTPSTSGIIEPFIDTPTGSTRKRLAALLGISVKKVRPSLGLHPDRENDTLARQQAEVMMVTSVSPNASAYAAAYSKDASTSEACGVPRGPSPYSAMSHSTTSSQRKVTPKSTMSKSSGGGRVAFANDTTPVTAAAAANTSSGSGRRHISRPMDASNSSSSSHQSHSQAHPQGRISLDTTGGRMSIETAAPRRSHISSRGRVSHGTFSFEKPAVAPLPQPRPFGSGLTPPQAQPLRTGVQMQVEEGSRDAQFGSTRSRGRGSMDGHRARLDSDEKSGASLMRAGSLGNSVRSAHSARLVEDEKRRRRGASLSEKDASPKEKTSCSSLGRLWLQKTKEALCQGRPSSQASIIIPTATAESAPSSAPAHVTTFAQAQAQTRNKRGAPLPARAQLPMFAFEPASSAGMRASTPESGRSRGTTTSSREREVAFKVPEIPERARERARFRRATTGEADQSGTNTYAAFCQDLRRVVGDDALVVFEKYVRQYESGAFPLSGPRGLVERLKKILDLSHTGEERKRNLVDRFVAIVRDSEAR